MTTEAGKRLIAEFSVGQYGRVERAVAAIEAEARDCVHSDVDQQRREAAAEAVTAALDALAAKVEGIKQDSTVPGMVPLSAVLALIEEARR